MILQHNIHNEYALNKFCITVCPLLTNGNRGGQDIIVNEMD